MILCCGESLIDMLPRTASTGEQAFAPVAGGAVFNTAIALGRLGAPAGCLPAGTPRRPHLWWGPSDPSRSLNCSSNR